MLLISAKLNSRFSMPWYARAIDITSFASPHLISRRYFTAYDAFIWKGRAHSRYAHQQDDFLFAQNLSNFECPLKRRRCPRAAENSQKCLRLIDDLFSYSLLRYILDSLLSIYPGFDDFENKIGHQALVLILNIKILRAAILDGAFCW